MRLETSRLILRPWKPSDLHQFAEMNADRETMKYFPSILTREKSDQLANKCQALIEQNGWGFWAVELKTNQSFIGLTGLHKTEPPLPFAPAVEIGWRFSKDAWGKGYATEAAKSALLFGFDHLRLDKVVSYTAATNHRSQAVMKRLGMNKSSQIFNHPNIPTDHPLSEHVLYRLNKSNE